MNEFEKRLRDSLAAHARHAPSGEELARRIIDEASAPVIPIHRARRWQTWSFPLITAGAVAAVAAALVGVAQSHHSAAPPAATHQHSPPVTPSPSPTPSTPPVSPSPTTSPVSDPSGVDNFRVADMTFVSDDDGWAIGTADCLHGGGTCTAMVHTTDGKTWHSLKNPPVNVPGINDCANACAQHIRFANDKIGYAFGLSVLLMTTDGGKTWTHQSGGAVALETFDRNVVRLSPVVPGCTLGCSYVVETSAIGTADWQPRQRITAYQLELVRGGHDAYVLTLPHTSGNAPSQLYRSADDGTTWTNAGQPCASSAPGDVTSSIAAGADGRVSVICTLRGAVQRSYLAVSTDHGAHFTARPGVIPSGLSDQLVGDSQTVLLAAGLTSQDGSGVYRSIDGGKSWQPAPGIEGGVRFAGFESTTVGRIVSGDGRTIWTTHDGGATWSAHTFR